MKTLAAGVLICSLILVMLSGVPARAQLTAGSVVGTVMDPSGAALAGANVTVKNNATGVSSSSVTNEAGIFGFPTLPVGAYAFEATRAGFQTSVGSFQIALNVQTSFSITLRLGTMSEKVDVTSEAPPVETTSTQITSTFSTSQVSNLPVASLDVNKLALLAPAVADLNTVGLTRGQLLQQVSTVAGGSVGSIGGSRARNNNFVLDGVDDNDPIASGPQSLVIQDAVQEFSLTKNNFDAEFGQFSGGLFNIITKSGSNELHGNAFEYFQNRNLNATDRLTQAGIASGSLRGKPRFDYNRLGGTVGGPVLRNKLFYFGAYEHEATGVANTSSTYVFPTAAGYQLLSSLGPGSSRFGTTASVSPFVLNLLKTYGATAATAASSSLFPTVLGTPIPVGPVTNAVPVFASNQRVLGSTDWNATADDLFHVRFQYNRGPNGVIAGFPVSALNANEHVENYFSSIGYTHTFSPSLLNEAHLAYHRQSTSFSVVNSAAATIPNISIGQIPLQIGPPSQVPSGSFNDIYQLLDDVSWQKGRHLIKFGVDLRNNIVTSISNVAPRGTYNYVNFEDFVTDIPPTVSGQRGAGSTDIVLNNYFINWYAQDQFKWTRNFTVYLGVRYEFNSLLRDMATQASESIADVPGLISFRKPTVSKNNWAPRVGFAWDVFGDGAMAVRGGYGISYVPIFGAFVGGGELPSSLQQVVITPCNPCAIPIPTSNFLQNGAIPNQLIPLNTTASARSIIASYVPDQVRPYLQTSTLSVERRIGRDWTVEARYLHTKGTHLSVQARLNAGIVPPLSAFLPVYFNSSDVPAQTTLNTMPTLNQFTALVKTPYTPFGFTSPLTTHLPIGDSTYNAGILDVRHNFGHSFQFDSNFTWSKNIDDATNEFFINFTDPRRPQDWRNLANERSVSVLDVPFRFVMDGVWNLPTLAKSAAPMRLLLGGWVASFTYIASSGTPFTPLSLANSVGNGDSTVQRVVVNPKGTSNIGSLVSQVKNSAGQVVGYLANNPAARFVQAGAGSFPNAGRNVLRAPGVNDTDFQALKRFAIDEKRSVEFAGQFFNLWNHPQFTLANLLAVDPGQGQNYAFVGSAGFNNIQKAGATGGARNIQLILKFVF